MKVVCEWCHTVISEKNDGDDSTTYSCCSRCYIKLLEETHNNEGDYYEDH